MLSQFLRQRTAAGNQHVVIAPQARKPNTGHRTTARIYEYIRNLQHWSPLSAIATNLSIPEG